MMLTSPGGAKVVCRAKKALALAVATIPKDGEPAMRVLFRSNDTATVRARGLREARKLSRPVMVFSLTTGNMLGAYNPDGTFVRGR